jgi:hypothetical protein
MEAGGHAKFHDLETLCGLIDTSTKITNWAQKDDENIGADIPDEGAEITADEFFRYALAENFRPDR